MAVRLGVDLSRTMAEARTDRAGADPADRADPAASPDWVGAGGVDVGWARIVRIVAATISACPLVLRHDRRLLDSAEFLPGPVLRPCVQRDV